MTSRIRRNSVIVITFVLASATHAVDQEYAARYNELRQQKAPDAQIEPLLNEWRTQKPDDPDAWINSANYYFNQRQTMISTKKPGKGDFGLTNAKTGKTAGSISFEQDPASIKRAVELLDQATKKFPDRLDIWCGLAFIQQESSNFDGEFETLKNMVAYAHEHSAALKWLKGENLPTTPDQFIPDKLHSYGIYYEKKENPRDDKRFLQIAMFSAEQYPNHPYAPNDVAVYYSIQKDNTKTREWLEKANKVDPKDTLVMTNLGYVCSKMGDNATARKWYEAVIKADPDGEHAARAKEALKKLKKK